MRKRLGALVMTTGAFAALPALGMGMGSEDCVAPTDGARIEAVDPTRSTTTLEWRVAREGAKVRIQMAADPGFGSLIFNREVPCCDLQLRSLDVGQYHWRVLDVEQGEAEQCRGSFEIVALPKQE